VLTSMLLVHGLNTGQHGKDGRARGPKHGPVCGSTAQTSMLNERRSNAIIASGRSVTCALDSTSHSNGNHRQGRHGTASCSTPCNDTCLRIVLNPCSLSTTEVSLNEMAQARGVSGACVCRATGKKPFTARPRLARTLARSRRALQR
jgi:hypothetical protein